MTAAALLVLAAGIIAAGLLGAAIHAATTEARHDCMPHDPDACRDTTGESR